MAPVKRKKLLFILNTAAFFLSHRRQLALKAQQEGYEVAVLAPFEDASVNEIRTLGFEFIDLPMSRQGINPFVEVLTLIEFYQVLKKINPNIVHAFTLKPILYSSILTPFFKYRLVTSFTGLGHLFTSESRRAKLVRSFVSKILQWCFSSEKIKVVFQNPDDQLLFEKMKVVKKNKSTLIPGTGVDTTVFQPHDGNNKPVIVFPARFLRDKGFWEMIQAGEVLQKKKIPFELWLMGKIDPGNPSSVSQEELKKISNLSFIKRIEYSKSMAQIYSQAQVVCLPSYREGIPLALIEASACGRAIVTTDVPGCRSIVDDGQNGYLVPKQNVEKLALALEHILTQEDLRKKMELASRAKALKEFDQKIVLAQNIQLYQTKNELPTLHL